MKTQLLTSLSYNITSQSQNIRGIVKELTPKLNHLKNTNLDAKRAISSITHTSSLKKDVLLLNIDGKFVELSSPEEFVLSVKEEDIKNKTQREVVLKNQLLQSFSGFSSPEEIEIALKTLFENIDFPLLKLRLFFRNSENQNLIKSKTEKAILPKKTTIITDSIIGNFNQIQDLLEKITVPGTHSSIKNGYPNIKTGIRGSKQIDFKQIGPNSEDCSINIVVDRSGNKNLVIILNNKQDNQENIIVTPDKMVLKSKNLSRIYNLGEKSVYYSEQELNSPGFEYKLEKINAELIKYRAYVAKRIEELNKTQEFFSTSEIGEFDKTTLKIISEIEVLFAKCRTKIHNLKDAPRKQAFKTKYNIDTQMSNPVLIIKRANSLQENIQISFPSIKGEKLMKIIITDSENTPKKGYIVHGNKLVKFDVHNPRKGFREKSKMNYHSQLELENSGLKEILPSIKRRFHLALNL